MLWLQYGKQTATLSTKGRQEEVAAMMKQQLQRHTKAQTAHFLTNAGLQVQGTSPQVTALVKSAGTGQNVTIPLPSIAVPQVGLK